MTEMGICSQRCGQSTGLVVRRPIAYFGLCDYKLGIRHQTQQEDPSAWKDLSQEEEMNGSSYQTPWEMNHHPCDRIQNVALVSDHHICLHRHF